MKERTVMDDKELTPKEAGDRLKLSPDTVRELLKTGELPGINRGAGRKRGRWFAYERGLAAFVARRETIISAESAISARTA